MIQAKKWFAVVLAAALLGIGCAGITERPDPPRVSLADMTVEKITLVETSFRIVLRVINPNPGAIDIRGISCDLDLNGEPFGTGVAPLDVTIPPFGTESLEVPLYSSNVRLFKGALSLPEREALEYRLRGKLHLSGEKVLIPTLPFESEGKWVIKAPADPARE